MKEIKSYKVELYQSLWNGLSLRREWRWRVKATNGKIIGAATESYVNKSDAIYNIKSLGLSLTNFKDEN